MTMNRKDIQRIRQFADGLTDLRDWEVDNISIKIEKIERLVPPGMNRTNRIAEKMAQEWDEVTRPHEMEYRKMVKQLLDDAWGPVACILELYSVQTAQRLDDTRRAILDQVSSDVKSTACLEMHGHKLAPKVSLREAIGSFIGALRDIAGQENKKGIILRLPKVIAGVVAFLAALLTCLYYLGWLEPFKAFISRIVLRK